MISLTADAQQAYVLYPHRAPKNPTPTWGEGTGLENPYFTAGDLQGWSVRGECAVEESDRGHLEAHLGTDGRAARISQTATGLEPGGRYVASVQVEIGEEAGQTRPTTISVRSGKDDPLCTTLERSTFENMQESDPKMGTRFQRIGVHFTAPRSGRVDLRIATEAGEARVRCAHVRVHRGTRPTKKGSLVHEDFEDVGLNYGPFVSSSIRAHLSYRNEPFTQKGWNGKTIDDVLEGTWSLKTRATAKGLMYRTSPASVPFAPGRRYRVAFDYQSDSAASWITAVDDPSTSILSAQSLPHAGTTTRFEYEFTAPSSGDAWVGLRSDSADSTEVVIDDFTVYELD